MARMQYLVLHCTATPEGREVTSKEIRHWHTDPVSKGGRGWKQVGYTDLIHLDGKVERLVDNNEDAEVDSWEITNGAKGYNSVSRHIVYAGGLAKDGKTAKGHAHGSAAEGNDRLCAQLSRAFSANQDSGTSRPAGREQSLSEFRCGGVAQVNRHLPTVKIWMA